MRVDVHPDAVAQFLQLVDQVSDYSSERAQALIEEYESVVEDLRHFPDLGRESRVSPGSRVLVRRGYLYWYERRSDHLVIFQIEAGALRTEPL